MCVRMFYLSFTIQLQKDRHSHSEGLMKIRLDIRVMHGVNVNKEFI